MKIAKAEFTVSAIKPTRERCLESEAEGRLAKGLTLQADLPIAKIKGLFSNAGSFERKVASAYDDKGQLLDEDGGTFALTTEGRACKATIAYGLVDTQEFEDSGLDSIKLLLQQGRVVTVKCRLKLHPEPKQLAKVDQWLKNKIGLTLNGETIIATEEAYDEAETGQQRMPLGGGAAPGHGEELEDGEDDSLQSGLDMLDEHNRTSVDKLAGDGVLAVKGRGKAPKMLDDMGRPIDEHGDDSGDNTPAPAVRTGMKPSTAHGEVVVPGQKPPQKPHGSGRKKPPSSETLQ